MSATLGGGLGERVQELMQKNLTHENEVVQRVTSKGRSFPVTIKFIGPAGKATP
jgi:hypothetical protein